MTNLLIADGGSTKIHWVGFGDGGQVTLEFFTTGVNPLVMSYERVTELLTQGLRDNLGAPVGRIEFYGAGCRGDLACGIVRKALQPFAVSGRVSVDSDMLGACRCLKGDEMGVVCILGTGANSCLYDGKNIVANVSPGGFILGDEGSGAWIGRRLASDLLKGLLPRHLDEAFRLQYGLDAEEIIRRVYRPGAGDDAPNRFLASLAPFVSEHFDDVSMQSIVRTGFTEFFSRNVASYFTYAAQREVLGVSFVGSVAKAFEPLLREVARELGYKVDIVAKSPMDALTGRIAHRNSEETHFWHIDQNFRG